MASIKKNWHLTKKEAFLFREILKEKKRDKKPFVVWGWKRDKVEAGVRFPESRTVYFSADLNINKNREVFIKRAFFYLDSTAKSSEVEKIYSILPKSKKLKKYTFSAKIKKDKKLSGYSRLVIRIGSRTKFDFQTIKRRLKGKPRLSIAPPRVITPQKKYDISKYGPFALYTGSGLSHESGLPLLAAIHKVFEVDDFKKNKLVFGIDDNLPKRIDGDIEEEFRNFCQFNIDAIKAKPAKSHELLAKLYKKGIVTQVLTDNVDDILRKVNVPYTQVRLNIFPERFKVEFDPKVKSLLVIGIAVDRREVIKQARHKKMKIISINPILGVAPYSRNMDYLTKGDILFKEKAKSALPKIIRESNFKLDE